ncbi:purine-cytosine permease family protein [Alicyclobacillus suci]|uniref:purine-cytosine permease family protein n=1 Tax=Alicyclobacillus suci TaxID=2816080 RepID=UPI00166244B2|nr:cytosine permease [Alicyclobacillus suci]
MDYGASETFVVEPHGIEHIPENKRYGRVTKLFNVWFASNLHLSTWTIGTLGITLGLNVIGAITAILAGTALGAIAVGVNTAMGPKLGMPQLAQSRASFGYRGNYVPAILAWLGFLGWFTVNNILGALAMKEALHVPYLITMLIMSIGTILMALYGHNLIHGFERIMTYVGGIVFLVVTIVVFTHPSSNGSLHHHNSVLIWLAEFTIMFSYAVGFSPYAADYGRYLPAKTRVRGPLFATALGLFVSIGWVSCIGAVTAARFIHSEPITLIGDTMGGFAVIAYIALALGSISSNVLNIYSASLSALTFDLPLKRWSAALLIGGLSIILSLIFSNEGSATNFIENFLDFLVYWVTPWFAIQSVEFFVNSRRRGLQYGAVDFYNPNGPMSGVKWKGLGSFILGVLVSIPFMASALYTGPIGHMLDGADISYFVSFVVAGGVYWIVTTGERRVMAADMVKPEISS